MPNRPYLNFGIETKGFFLFLAALFLLAGTARAEEAFVLEKADPEPNFKSLKLKNLAGEDVSLDDYKGSVVLLNYCSSWCAPCWQEFPSMQKLYDRFKERGLVVVALVVENGSIEKAKKFREKTKTTFPMIVDVGGNAMETAEIGELPVSYIIGRDGKLLGKITGARDWTSPASLAYFDSLLKER